MYFSRQVLQSWRGSQCLTQLSMADADDPRKTMIYKFLGSGFSAGKGICQRIDLFEISKMSPGVIKWDSFFLGNHNQTSRCNNGIFWWNGVIFFLTWDQGNDSNLALKMGLTTGNDEFPSGFFCGTEVEPNARVWDSWPKMVWMWGKDMQSYSFLITGDESNWGTNIYDVPVWVSTKPRRSRLSLTFGPQFCFQKPRVFF